MSPIDILDVLQAVDEQISNPGAFCTSSAANAASLCLLMTQLFKVSADSTNKTFGPFDELLVDGFDGETIWEELQTRNRPLTRFLQKKINVIDGRIQKVMNNKLLATSANGRKRAIEKVVIPTGPGSESDDVADDDSEGLEDHPSADELQDHDNDDDFGSDDNGEEEEEENSSGDEEVNLEILDDDNADEDEEYSGGGDAEYDDIDNMQAWLDKQEEMEEKHEKKLERLQKLAAQKGAVEEVYYEMSKLIN